MTCIDCPWPPGPDKPRLSAGDVHVWCMPLDVPQHEADSLRAVLSDDELQRADRFLSPDHRRRFVVGRARLRQVLASYLNESAERIRFQYGRLGKPALAAPWCESRIHFNVSNSHEMALCALAMDRELGVDVEHIRPLDNFDGLAERYYAPCELETLRSLPEEQRLTGFFNCWTRKEALLKAVGTGLSFPLDRVVVTLVPDEPARLLSFHGQPGSASQWWLEGLQPASGYVAAVAWPGDPPQIQLWNWQG